MRSAWEDFVKTQAQAVLDSALRVVGNSADAEDIAQEVFMEIFRNGKLREFTDQPAWVRTLATRRALDRLRRRKIGCDLMGAERDVREHEPSDYAIAAELDQRLRAALVRLPPREAEVFGLSVLEAGCDQSMGDAARCDFCTAGLATWPNGRTRQERPTQQRSVESAHLFFALGNIWGSVDHFVESDRAGGRSSGSPRS